MVTSDVRIFAAGLSAFAIMAVSGAAPALEKYVGKYPFDKINGVSFIKHPEVRRSVRAAVMEDSVVREVLGNSTTSPIKKSGALLISPSCRPHECGDVNWTIVMLAPRGPAAICYHNTDLMGDRSRWFIKGYAKFQFAGDCSWANPLPSEVAAALVTAN